LVGAFLLSACDQAGNFASITQPTANSATSAQTGDTASAATGVSEGRKNAARLITPGSAFLVDLLQFDGGPGQQPCYPLGDPVTGAVKWPSRLHNLPGFPIVITSNFFQSEYDLLTTKGDTQYVLSVRVGWPQTDPHFTQVEFNFRAVNPFEANHVAGGMQPHYLMHEADYPSNDGVVANRSLIDLNGGDIAILIQGLDFAGLGGMPDANTSAWMNGLGPLGWVAFMRDNAFQSGRFYAIEGARLGGPVALTDTPWWTDDGMFQSVQVRGDVFDGVSEHPSWLTTPPPRCHVCPWFSPNAPTNFYALLDYSNYNEAGVPTGGRGGFVFVMRAPGFSNLVAIDPSAFPGEDPDAHPGNEMPAPGSGYAEAALHTAGIINHPTAVDNPPFGPQGVHELSVSVFFIHTWEVDQGPGGP
jgi:hypothetical protein